VTIVGPNALCVNILTQSAWSIAHWGDFARRHYGEFATVVGVPAPGNGDAMAEIRGWLQRLGEDPETISEVLEACARDPGVMAGYLQSAREVPP
jgi:hypothetical protein